MWFFFVYGKVICRHRHALLPSCNRWCHGLAVCAGGCSLVSEVGGVQVMRGAEEGFLRRRTSLKVHFLLPILLPPPASFHHECLNATRCKNNLSERSGAAVPVERFR